MPVSGGAVNQWAVFNVANLPLSWDEAKRQDMHPPYEVIFPVPPNVQSPKYTDYNPELSLADCSAVQFWKLLNSYVTVR